jgi:chromosome segregation ATPase
MEELLIYFEKEVYDLRRRVTQQNKEIISLTQQLEDRYRLYADLESEFNQLKEEYETYKTDFIKKNSKVVNNNNVIPPFELGR